MTTINYSGTLTVTTCWCGMRHAVPTEMHDHQQGEIYCPLEHSHVFAGKGEAVLLREKLERARKASKATRDLLEHEQRSHAATRGHLTRTKKRVGNGVCPCCSRTFKQLSRHMASKHPDYTEEQA